MTPASACIISGTSSGLEILRTILEVMCSMSLLPITLQAAVIAAKAAVLTSRFGSDIDRVT